MTGYSLRNYAIHTYTYLCVVYLCWSTDLLPYKNKGYVH